MKNNRLVDMDFCVIDTETTGGRAVDNRIIDVAVFHFRGEEIVDRFQSLINPERPIPQWITQLTGISDEMVKDAPVFSDIADSLLAFLERGVFTAHNAKFDFGFVKEEFARLGQFFDQPQCCTLKLARQLYPELSSRSLGALCEHLMIDIWDRHRAGGDAEATVYVLKDLLRKVQKDHGIETWTDLDGFSRVGHLTLPSGLTFQSVSRLPASPGTYVFKDKKGTVVWKGQTKDIQRRVKTFFQSHNTSDKSNYFREVVKKIEVVKGS